MVLESGAGGRLKCLIRSLTTLQRRRYDQQMLEPCKRCFYTIMANFHGSLEAVDRHIHSVRYDMVLESGAHGRLRCLIRSPTTLELRRYDQQMLEPCKRCFYTIMANYDGPLEAVDRFIQGVILGRLMGDELSARLCHATMDAEDKGHRHGNFANYYSFHPPQNRLLILEQCGLMNYIRGGLVIGADDDSKLGDDGSKLTSTRKKARLDIAACAADVGGTGSIAEKDDIIYYCDLGCNEGDLTIAMASSLWKAVDNNTKQNVRCLGLDIDSTLIERASNKFSCKEVDDKEKEEFMPVFKDCNLCSSDAHNNACSSFFADSTKTHQEIMPMKMFSLTTIFSTTMWIHIHSGDDGLTRFLERACGWTKKYLLIEPQHSGW
eukprot:scaffold5691_cov81-Skeletonema_dohrnii-CCMP3373.AAC.2